MKIRSAVRFRWLVPLLLVALSAPGATHRLLILHTNDVHDHVRAGENGLGGLPYVAGCIAAERAGRDNVLVLDAGDVTEKGDLVAFRTHGVMTYEALRRIGYDGVALGNHDFDDLPPVRLREFEEALGQGLLCLNVLRPDGAARFTPSRLLERGGLKIGLIGLIVPRAPAQGGLDFAASGRALAAEAARLRAAGAQLLVAVCHESVPKCADWARAAPEVQVFVSGHSHQVLQTPVVVPETGAVIVQAGSYARWVGRLELEFDAAAGKVVRHEGRLVPMQHARVAADAAMLTWVQQRERELAPEAADLVFRNPAEIDGFAVARLAAEALRLAAGADVGFCHPYQIIRNILPAGPIDVNAVFKTGGHRAHDTIIVELTGAQIAAYADALENVQREPPEWAGFCRWRDATTAGGPSRTDLDAQRRYSVVMAKLEWETRYQRLAEKIRGRDPTHPLAAGDIPVVPSPTTFTKAVCDYITAIVTEGGTVQDRIAGLDRSRSTPP